MCNNITVENKKDMKIAIVHDQLTQYGGAEKTLEVLLDIFPDSTIFTGYCDPINISDKILKAKIVSGVSKNSVWTKKLCKSLGFLMPTVFESFDLRKFDVVISEGTAWPKGVLTYPNQLHITYVYTPPRFLYGYATEGQKRNIWYLKPFLYIIDHFLRLWDYTAAQRADYVLSISTEIQKRVWKFYRRKSDIIYPPVEIPTLTNTINSNEENNDYYLCISRLAAYKNIDTLIKAFNKTGYKLKIAGTGKEYEKLKSIASSNIELLGFVTEDKKKDLLTNCKGFIFPTDYEDFGIVVVEALSYGKPVMCHNTGGPVEIVSNSKTGMLFSSLDIKDFANSIEVFNQNIDKGLYDKEQCITEAQKYSVDKFKSDFYKYVMNKWEEKRNARTS